MIKPIKAHKVNPNTAALLLLAILTNNMKLNFGLEVSPISFCFIFLALALNMHIIKMDSSVKITLFTVAVSTGATIPFFKPIDFAKDILFFCTLIAGFIVARDEIALKWLVKRSAQAILVICIFQYLVPGYEVVHDVLFGRSSSGGNRGLTSFLAEPSFLGAVSSILIINYGLLHRSTNLLNTHLIILLIPLLFSFSVMILFGLAVFFYILKWRLTIKILVVCVMTVAVWPIFSKLDVRLIMVLTSVFASGTLDQSSDARLFYILKDFKLVISSFMLPIWGMGGYSFALENVDFRQYIPQNFIYDPKLSGSLLGRYLVTFGVFSLLIPVYYLQRASFKALPILFFYGVVISCLSLQMLPTGLIPFVLFLGSGLHALHTRTRASYGRD
ncbi:hypothetical protein N9Y59_01675 [Planktomarina temperata]|nr:hypothetical protein [Planktomarina temperata]